MAKSETGNGPFEYKPNLPMAYIMAILWVITLVYMMYQYISQKSWFFWCMIVGVFTTVETIGYVARISAINTRADEGTPVAYIINFTLLLLAPSFLAAGCYMAFGRVIYYVAPPARRNVRNMWVPARFITPIFVVLDILSFLIVALGGIRVSAAITKLNEVGSNKAKARSDLEAGYNTAKIGVIVQLACFGFFTFVGARILFVAKQWQSQWPDSGAWKRLAWAINGACALILFRSIFRLIEFLGGASSDYISKHEAFIYVFDAFPMLFVFFIFFAIPPAKYLPRMFMSVRFKKHLAAQEKAAAAGGMSSGVGGAGVPMGSYVGYQRHPDDSEAALQGAGPYGPPVEEQQKYHFQEHR
ncbi:RTA1 like protein-domain-containing protein [Geopyxis carbonaria]|nr:RTA1 like protein-domain-containing protein [Geopyxis carbonaria]